MGAAAWALKLAALEELVSFPDLDTEVKAEVKPLNSAAKLQDFAWAQGATPLLLAVQAASRCSADQAAAKAVQLLLSHSANIEAQSAGEAALHGAARSGLREVVKVLLEGRADPMVRNAQGATPHALAQRAGRECAALLAEAEKPQESAAAEALLNEEEAEQAKLNRAREKRREKKSRQREKEKRASTPEKEPKAAKAFVMRAAPEPELSGEGLQKRVAELKKEKARAAQKAKHLQRRVEEEGGKEASASSRLAELRQRSSELRKMLQEKKAITQKAEEAEKAARHQYQGLAKRKAQLQQEVAQQNEQLKAEADSPGFSGAQFGRHSPASGRQAGMFRLLRLLPMSVMGTPPYAAVPPLSRSASFQLRDGAAMPVMGLGVYMSQPGEETYNAVKWALQAGYRMIDTAAIYGNEESVGQAIADSGLARDEIFLTTKLWDADHGFDAAQAALGASLRKLRVEYLDLYLIHSPNTGKIVETWDSLLQMQKAGKIRAVGVSNFGVKHLEALQKFNRPMPVVNQIEMHPMNYQERVPLLDFCKLHGILVQAYGSMFFGRSEFLERPEVAGVAQAKGASSAQVLLRWALQMGFQVIPKSVKKHRIEENLGVFDVELSEEEMRALSAMQGKLGQYWQPLDAPVDVGDTSKLEL
ncbi:unnamed protein product [Effrenium voratum]|uniref:NADP-dependent oxidoreductase domain-containing protein n=1 Tax=Effrenium voratum TaxID=2562239 RepID=A0AA36N156_9DINO|nr:unnamed protein product [Effrenium voratum]